MFNALPYTDTITDTACNIKKTRQLQRNIGSASRCAGRNSGISMCAVIISSAKIYTQFNLILREERGERGMPQDPFIAFLLSAFIIGQSLAHLWFIPLSKYRWAHA